MKMQIEPLGFNYVHTIVIMFDEINILFYFFGKLTHISPISFSLSLWSLQYLAVMKAEADLRIFDQWPSCLPWPHLNVTCQSAVLERLLCVKKFANICNALRLLTGSLKLTGNCAKRQVSPR